MSTHEKVKCFRGICEPDGFRSRSAEIAMAVTSLVVLATILCGALAGLVLVGAA